MELEEIKKEILKCLDDNTEIPAHLIKEYSGIINPPDRDDKIQKIKEIIKEWGGFSSGELEADSPLLNSMGKDHFQLVERFDLDSVDVNTYVHDTNTDCEYMSYEDLPDSVIDDIYELALDYREMCEETMDKCRDENI